MCKLLKIEFWYNGFWREGEAGKRGGGGGGGGGGEEKTCLLKGCSVVFEVISKQQQQQERVFFFFSRFIWFKKWTGIKITTKKKSEKKILTSHWCNIW